MSIYMSKNVCILIYLNSFNTSHLNNICCCHNHALNFGIKWILTIIINDAVQLNEMYKTQMLYKYIACLYIITDITKRK